MAENLSILTSLPTLSPTEPSFCCLYCLLSLGYIYTAAPPPFHTLLCLLLYSFPQKIFFFWTHTYISQARTKAIYQIKEESFSLKTEKMALSLNSIMSFPPHKLSSKSIKLRTPRVLMASALHSTSK